MEDATTWSIRILVVENEPLLAERLACLRAQYSDLELVGAASAVGDAVAIASALRPDVALIDPRLPDADGIELCDHLHHQLPNAAVIILSNDASDELRLRAVESGACGFLSKEAPDQDVVETILRAAEGEFLLPRAVTLRLFRKERELRSTPDAGGPG